MTSQYGSTYVQCFRICYPVHPFLAWHHRLSLYSTNQICLMCCTHRTRHNTKPIYVYHFDTWFSGWFTFIMDIYLGFGWDLSYFDAGEDGWSSCEDCLAWSMITASLDEKDLPCYLIELYVHVCTTVSSNDLVTAWYQQMRLTLH